MVPTTAIALLFSALARESRYAGFAWFAVWIFGWVLYGSVLAASLGHPTGIYRKWSLVSLYHLLGNVQSWIFGLHEDAALAQISILMLGAITVVCFLLVLRKVAAPMQV